MATTITAFSGKCTYQAKYFMRKRTSPLKSIIFVGNKEAL